MITTFPSAACLCKSKERQQGSHSETAATDYACMDALCIAEVDLKSRQVKFEPGDIMLNVSTGKATAGGLSGRMGKWRCRAAVGNAYGQINGFVRLFGMTRSPRWGQSPVHAEEAEALVSKLKLSSTVSLRK